MKIQSDKMFPAGVERTKNPVSKPVNTDSQVQADDSVELGSSQGKSRVLSKINDWVKENITGEQVRGKNGASGAKAIKDYSCQHKNYAAIGAASGGAVGVAVGLYGGLQDLKSDKPELIWKTNDIKDPKMDGFRHSVMESGHYERDFVGYDSDGNAEYRDRYVIDGYWHNYSPEIKYDQVGTYKTPEYKHSSKWTPFSGGLVGLLGGTAIGGLIGLAVSVIQKAVETRKQ